MLDRNVNSCCQLLAVLASLLAGSVGYSETTPTPKLAAETGRPNILVLMLDDAGWTDVGCFGANIDTPAIDALAAAGMKFTDCHSAAPNCSPSRAGLLTGRTPSRAGIFSYLPAKHPMHLRDEEVTLAELLQGQGYATGHFGKWHLSQLMSSQPGPGQQGFDYWFATDNNAAPSHRNPVNFVRNNQRVGKLQGYSCDIVASEARQWLSRWHREQPAKPFFACVWFHEPHQPIASPPELVAKYRQRFPDLTRREAEYHANVENADRAIGGLLQHLDQLDVADDTLVFFTSDNGPLNKFSARGLKGRKSHVWEGGHRVPGIVRWPGHVAAGAVCDQPVSAVDFLPTVCELTGTPTDGVPPTDGTSWVPLLQGRPDEFARRQPLYWFFYRVEPSLALRMGKWSLIANTNDSGRPKAHALVAEDIPKIRASVPEGLQLYDLSTDPQQQRDLAAQQPGQLQKLSDQLQHLHRSVLGDAWYWQIPTDYAKGKKRRLWTTP